MRRISIVRRLVYAFVPLLLLLLAGEAVTRARFFVMHDYDWNWLTMPYKLHDETAIDHSTYVPPDSSSTQMVFKMGRPCENREVFSGRFNKMMPYTWDDNCFRGDHITKEKPAGETRLIVFGGSTVEDTQADADMWTMRLKETLANPAVKVVNAGQSGLGSQYARSSWDLKLHLYRPDIVLYYEAWNEQVDFLQWNQVGSRIDAARNAVHGALYYRSALYTYSVEKYFFARTTVVAGGKSAGLGPLSEQFWVIDEPRLRENLRILFNEMRDIGTAPVFVTQVINFPRHWKGADTFDETSVRGLIEKLKNDRSYTYDVYEISALNQRLAVAESLRIAGEMKVPVIDLLAEIEAVGEEGRKPLFEDLGHLTWRGNELVGPLVARKLMTLGLLPPGPTSAAAPGNARTARTMVANAW